MWTKESFAGDIRLDYEYTKTDDATEAVTILYLQATGSGAKGDLRGTSHDERQERFPGVPEWFQSLAANRETGIVGLVDFPAGAGRLGDHLPTFSLAKLVDRLEPRRN